MRWSTTLAASVAACLMIGVDAASHAQTIGPGPGITDTGSLDVDTPGGDRLNVDESAFVNLSAGTYDVGDFGLNVLTHTSPGTIAPILLSGSPASYTTLWVGPAFDPVSNGVQAVPYALGTQQFTLGAATDVRAGFFTQALGSDIIGVDANNSGFDNSSLTSHDGDGFAVPTVGSTVDGFSHPGLGRTYAFEINVFDAGANNSLVGPGSGIIDSGLQVDTPNEDRLNVDHAAVNLPAGIYNVDDFNLQVATHDAGIGGAGTITPMLLTGVPSSYTTLWVGPAFDPANNGIQTVTYSAGTEQFTLAAATDVRVGFFTQSQGSAILALDGDNSGSGNSTTSHDANGFPVPAIGSTVDDFSHPSLNRTYAFDVNVTLVPEPSTFVICVLGILGLFICQRRRIVAH